MSYTTAFDVTKPTGSEPPGTLDDIIREFRLQVKERHSDMFGVDLTDVTDPQRIKKIVVPAAGLKIRNAADNADALSFNSVGLTTIQNLTVTQLTAFPNLTIPYQAVSLGGDVNLSGSSTPTSLLSSVVGYAGSRGIIANLQLYYGNYGDVIVTLSNNLNGITLSKRYTLNTPSSAAYLSIDFDVPYAVGPGGVVSMSITNVSAQTIFTVKSAATGYYTGFKVDYGIVIL